MSEKRIAILGSTGSIGKNTLEVVSRYADRFHVVGLSAHKNVAQLLQQIERFHPAMVAVTDDAAFREVSRRVDGAVTVLSGAEGLVTLSTHDEVEMVVSAIVGAAGLEPTLAAIQAGKDIALANKETLVVGGELITSAVMEKGVRLIPIDSEHSAIFQSILGHSKSEIRKLILTASGGPFRTWPREKMEAITPSEALRHPNWEMGAKITIDSATMMNKGLEIIEARWLFGVAPENIEVLIHPESIVHSMVEYLDGVVIAQLGVPDMKIPIAYALGYPERLDMGLKPLNLAEVGCLTFEKPDSERFPALTLAYQALERGKTYPAVLNAANEMAVQAFLNEEISFLNIPEIVSHVLSEHDPRDVSLDTVMAADHWGRRAARDYIEKSIKEAT